MSKKALMIVDMVNDSLENIRGYQGKAAVPGAEGIIPNIQKLLCAGRAQKTEIIYANDCHSLNSPALKKWIKEYSGSEHCIEGTFGAQVVDELKPKKVELILTKEDFSVFSNPDADRLIKERGINELFVVGVAIRYCIRGSVLDAGKNGYKVNLVVDACTGIDFVNKGDQSKALLEMGNAGVRPIYTSQVLEELL